MRSTIASLVVLALLAAALQAPQAAAQAQKTPGAAPAGEAEAEASSEGVGGTGLQQYFAASGEACQKSGRRAAAEAGFCLAASSAPGPPSVPVNRARRLAHAGCALHCCQAPHAAQASSWRLTSAKARARRQQTSWACGQPAAAARQPTPPTPCRSLPALRSCLLTEDVCQPLGAASAPNQAARRLQNPPVCQPVGWVQELIVPGLVAGSSRRTAMPCRKQRPRMLHSAGSISRAQ